MVAEIRQDLRFATLGGGGLAGGRVPSTTRRCSFSKSHEMDNDWVTDTAFV